VTIDAHDAWAVRVVLQRFQEHRQLRETLVVHEPAEGVQAHEPFADVRVPIDATRERLLRVVQVKRLQACKSDFGSEASNVSA
jgi:hypothetical protein